MTIPSKYEVQNLLFEVLAKEKYKVQHTILQPKRWIINDEPKGSVNDTQTIKEADLEMIWASRGEQGARDWLHKKINRETGL